MDTSEEISSQHYHLKWTNHTNNFVQMVSGYFNQKCLVDVTLSCEGQFLKVHKMVLSSCSDYFQDLFQIHTAKHPLIIINGAKFAILQQIVNFMYQGEIKVNDIDLDDLLSVAENLQVKGLCKIGKAKLETNLETSLPDNSSCENSSNCADTVVPKSRKRRKQSYSELNGEQESCSSERSPNGKTNSSIIVNTMETTSITALGVQKKSTNNIDEVAEKHEAKFLRLTPITKLFVPHVFNGDAPNQDKTLDKQGSKIPQPPNAFMIYANEWRKKLAEENPEETNKEISIRLGHLWKSLPAITKDAYYVAAKKADEEHKIKYPRYYYSPKEARLRKEQRGVVVQKNEQRAKSVDATVETSLIEDNGKYKKEATTIKEDLESFYFVNIIDKESSNSNHLVANKRPHASSSLE